MTSRLDPNIWGPPFWFTLHTITMAYPHHPNAVTKKKYYEFVQNIPLFIPVQEISNDFSKLLDEYPITAYLDDRESFIRWMWFIHNKINQKLEKETITLNDFYIKYYENYKPTGIKNMEYYKWRGKIIYAVIIIIILISIYYLYNK